MQFPALLLIFAALLPGISPACGQEKSPADEVSRSGVPGVPETTSNAKAETTERLVLNLPTENRGIFENRPESFYMGVDRGGKRVWQGGTFGFVRSPMTWSGGTVCTRFHEGIDIAPVKRHDGGMALDEVGAISDGIVVLAATRGRTEYGNQVVCRHEWPGGPVFSRYAHLSSVSVAAGAKVKRGQVIGVMGHTGGALTVERAHLHLEINLMRNESLDRTWLPERRVLDGEPKYHPANFAGVDAAALFVALRANPALTFPEFVRSQAPYFTVAVAADQPVDLLKRHPWLGDGKLEARGWKVSFTEWGLPLRFEAVEDPPPEPRVVWVRPFDGKHAWRTGGLLLGTGESASLSTGGLVLIRFIFGKPL